MSDVENSEAELINLVADIVAEAKAQGADQAEVSASADTGLSVSVRNGELENLEFNSDRGFGVTVYCGQSKGAASTTDSSSNAIRETVAAALRIAKYTQDDACNGLADADLMPEKLADLDLYHPWSLDADEATELALRCEAAGLAVDTRLQNSDGAQVNSQQSIRAYGNSHGFTGSYSGTRQGISCVLIGEDSNGMQRDYWYTVSRSFEDLETPESVGERAGQRTVGRLSPRKAPVGKFPVVFSPTTASGLIGHLINAISGGAQYRKASFLLGARDTQVLPEWLSLEEQPHLKRGLGSANFDGDGVATRSKRFVSEGVLSEYVLSIYSARKLDLAPTGNAGGVYNLDIVGQTTNLEALYGEMGSGLLVTELMGQGINGVTGDYSRGAAGYWIEHGEIQYPVAEVTVAGNLREMYQNIAAIGDDFDYRSNIRSPSILVEGLTLAGAA